jgi:predicted CxxxxCH...CXXCH cytochrome family protein
MRTWIATLGLLIACHGGTTGSKDVTGPSDGTDTGTPTTTTTTTDDGFCAVRRAFVQECVVCHDAENALGGLDLQTDAIAATVNVTSAAYGVVLVTPGDPAGSLLWRKVAGTQAGDEGDPMPPNGALPAVADTVRQWILDGATDACGTPGTTTTTGPYHPAGWDAPDVHGMATKLQTETDCRTCHGPDLGGGTSGVACDDCHAAGWETDCTFCHGGVSSTTGAPPEDIDDNADPATITFVPHEVHQGARIMPLYDCDQCHVKPTDALTPGHLFDDPTAGEAEVVIQGGTYAAGTCGTNYCHGNGRGFNGTVDAGDGPRSCTSCHAGPSTASQLSGRHADHLREGITCSECHPDAQGNATIDQPELHVNGLKEVDPAGTITWNAATGRCAGTCHFEGHGNRSW